MCAEDRKRGVVGRRRKKEAFWDLTGKSYVPLRPQKFGWSASPVVKGGEGNHPDAEREERLPLSLSASLQGELGIRDSRMDRKKRMHARQITGGPHGRLPGTSFAVSLKSQAAGDRKKRGEREADRTRLVRTACLGQRFKESGLGPRKFEGRDCGRETTQGEESKGG